MRPKKNIPVHLLLPIYFLFAGSLLAQKEDVLEITSEMIEITVSEGITPTFTWTGDIKVGRLLVMQGSKEFWGTETEGENIYQSPIRLRGIYRRGR